MADCPEISIDYRKTLGPPVTNKTNDEIWEEIREKTQCIECKNTSYSDNYGLVTRDDFVKNAAKANLCPDASQGAGAEAGD